MKNYLTNKLKKWGFFTKNKITLMITAGVLFVAAGVLSVTLATPYSAWITLPSANCLPQSTGNTLVEGPGTGADVDKSFIYVAFGNSNDFKRFDPATGNCEVTNLSGPSRLFDDSTSGVSVDTDQDGYYESIYFTTSVSSSPLSIYHIPSDTWINDSTAKAYDSSNSEFIAPLPFDFINYGNSAVAYNGKIYAFNGQPPASFENFAEYDPTTNTWTDKGRATAETGYPPSFLVADDSGIYKIQADTLTFYDDVQDSWFNRTSAPVSFGDGTAVVYVSSEDSLYVLGGKNTTNFYKYDITGDSWSTLTNTPGVTYHGTSMSYPGSGDYIYVLSIDKFWRYSITGNSWDTGTLTQPNFKAGRGSHAVSNGTDIYMSLGGNKNTFKKYNIAGNTWSNIDDMPTDGTFIDDRFALTYLASTNTIYAINKDMIFRMPLTGGNAETWPAYILPYDSPGNFDDSTAITNPGPSTEDPEGDNLYIFYGGTGFTKFNTTKGLFVPWTISTAQDGSTPLAQYGPTGSATYLTNGSNLEIYNDNFFVLQGGSNDDMYVYDAENNAWDSSRTITLPATVGHGGSITNVQDGWMYILGGNNTSNFWKFYPDQNKVIQAPTSINDSNEPIMDYDGLNSLGVMTYLNDKIYFFPYTGAPNVYFEYYDPDQNNWTELPAFECSEANDCEINGITNDGTYLYIINRSGGYTRRFDPSDNTWSNLTSSSFVSDQACMTYVASTNKLYATTGSSSGSAFYSLDLSSPTSWTSLGSTPAINYGCAMTTVGDIIYMAGGNNTTNFWEYDTSQPSPSWVSLSNTPDTTYLSSLTTDGTDIYASRGNDTTDFWMYDVSGNSWTVLESSPVTQTTGPGGAGLIYDNDGAGNINIWMSKGDDSDSSPYHGTFYRYVIASTTHPEWVGTWPYIDTPAQAPGTVAAGGSLTYPGSGNYLYAFRGNSTNEFWSYDMVNDIWLAITTAMMDNGDQLSQDNYDVSAGVVNQGIGNSIAELNGEFYVLAGNNTRYFQKFNPSTNTWTNLMDTPANIGNGASLVTIDNNTMFAFRGGSTSEFWKYDVPSDSWVGFSRGLTESGDLISQTGSTQGPGNRVVKVNNNVSGDPEFYVMAGGGTSTFEKYNPATNTWTTLTDVRGSVDRGGAMVAIGTDIYVFRSAYYFYKYDTLTDSWTDLQRLPSSSYGGTDMTYPGSGDYIYSTVSNYPTFYAYCFQDTGSGCTVNTWYTMASLPDKTYDGGSILGVGNYIYALRGAGSDAFYRYDISGNSWTTLTGDHVPPATVHSGAKLVTDGTYIYTPRGKNTNEFWRYDPNAASDNWVILRNAPTLIGYNSGTSTYYAKGAIVYCDNCGDGEIWLASGKGVNGSSTAADGSLSGGLLFRYDITTNTWPHEEATKSSPSTINYGGALGYPGVGDLIYAFRGGNNATFWNYDIGTNDWSGFIKGTLDYNVANDNEGKNIAQSLTNQGYGNAMKLINGEFYVLAGASTVFQKYNPQTNKWTDLAPTPASVNRGATLEGADTDNNGTIDAIFAFQGNSTQAFWKYDLTTGRWSVLDNIPLYTNAGASLTYPGKGDLIYAVRGAGYAQFYAYKMSAPAGWITLSPVPSNVYGGGSLVSTNDGNNPLDIYAMVGNNTNNIYRYAISDPATGAGTWSATSRISGNPALTLPSWTGNVGSGGSLAYDGTGTIYASRGYAGPYVQKYDIATNTWTALADFPVNIGLSNSSNSQGGLAYISSGPSGAGELWGAPGYSVNGTTGSLFRMPFTGPNANTWPTAQMPTSSPFSSVSAGGALQGLNDGGTSYLYALLGGNSNTFLQYTISDNASGTGSWSTVSPTGLTLPAIKSGGSLTYADRSGLGGNKSLFITRGTGTNEIYEYNIDTNVLSSPAGTFPDIIGADSTSEARGGIAYSSTEDDLYVTTGWGVTAVQTPGTGLLFRYPFTGTYANTWPLKTNKLSDAPATVGPGGYLTSIDGANPVIYAITGNNSNNFYQYDTGTGSWTSLTSMPSGSGSVNYGGSLTNDGTNIYASKGTSSTANTAGRETYFYCIEDGGTGCTPGTWTALANSPVNIGNNLGGNIHYYNNSLWALSGNASLRFEDNQYSTPNYTASLYRYDIGTDSWPVFSYEAGDLTNSSYGSLNGTSLASLPDGSAIYLLRGTNSASTTYPNLLRFDISGSGLGTWTNKENLLSDSDIRRTSSGASIVAVDNNTLYATRGYASTDFAKYDVTGDSWTLQAELPAASGTTSAYNGGELLFLNQFGSIFYSPGNDDTDPYSLYSYPINRLVVTCITKADNDTETNTRCASTPITPVAGESFGIQVQAVSGDTDTPVPINVTNNTDVTVSLKNGNGNLTGNLTGTISAGQNTGTITGLYYDIADGGIILSAADSTSPANSTTLALSDSDPFSVDPSAPQSPVLDVSSGSRSGNTAVTITGSNFFSTYRKPMQIVNSDTNALTDYPVQITIDTATLVNEGKMRPDCNDIRFTTDTINPYDDSTNKVPYWIESGCNSTQTSIWIKVSVPASSTETVYMNYGDKRLFESESETMPIFSENFDTGTVDPTKWYSYSTSVTNGKLTFNSYGSKFYSLADFNRADNMSVTFDFKPTYYSTSSSYYTIMGWKDTTTNVGSRTASVGSGGWIHGMNSNGTYNDDLYENGVSSDSIGSQTWVVNQQYKIRITMDPVSGATYERSTDGGQSWTTYQTTSARTDTQAKFGFYSYNQYGEIDNIMIKPAGVDPDIMIDGEEASIEVEFDTSNAYVYSASTTELKILTPAHAPATVDVTVTNADGQFITASSAYTFEDVTLDQIDPPSDTTAGGSTITLTGTNFSPGEFQREITITNDGAAETDFQIPITLDTEALIDSGKMNADGGDIRFYGAATKTNGDLLPYYIEGPINSTQTKIWVKVPSIAATPDTTTIYLTYGDQDSHFSNCYNLLCNNPSETFESIVDTGSVIASWNMDEASGDLIDSSGNNITATDYGTTVTTGKYDNGRAMTGATYAQAIESSLFNVSNGLTIETWVNPTSTTSGVWPRLVSKASNLYLDPTSILIDGYELGIGDPDDIKTSACGRSGSLANVPFLVVGEYSPTYCVAANNPLSPATGTWHHIVATFDLGTQTGNIYVDGLLAGTNNTMTVGEIGTNNYNMTLGRNNYSTNSSAYFDGVMDQTRIYDRALTLQQAQDLYNYRTVTLVSNPGNVYGQKISSSTITPTVESEMGVLDVSVDGTPVNTLATSSTSAYFIAPPHASGTVDVVLTNSDSSTVSIPFVYGQLPSITPPLSPDSGSLAGGTSVTITGENFESTPDPEHPGQELTVMFGANAGTIVSSNSTEIVVTTPASSTGTGPVDVTVINTNTQSTTLTGGFTYTAATTDPTNSTVTADPISEEADGINFSIITVNLKDDGIPPNNSPSRLVELVETNQTAGTSDIDAVDCTTNDSLNNTPAYQSTTDGDGLACFKVKTLPSGSIGTIGDYIFEATDIEEPGSPVTVTQTATVSFTGLITSTATSTFTAPAGDIPADGSTTKTLTAVFKNENDILIPGITGEIVQETMPGGIPATITPVTNPSDGTGTAEFTASSTKAGTYGFRVKDTTADPDILLDDVSQFVEVTFLAGSVDFDPLHSTVAADPATIAANGFQPTEITVTLRDTNDNPVSGKEVSLAQTAGPGASNITALQNITDINGRAVFSVTTYYTGSYTFEATDVTDGNTVLTQTASLTTTGPTAGDSTIISTPPTNAANGVSTSRVTVTLKDGSGFVFPGRSITLSKAEPGTITINNVDCDTGTSTGTNENGTTDDNGKACYNISSTIKSVFTFSFYNNTEGFTGTDTAQVSFISGTIWDQFSKKLIGILGDNSTYWLTRNNDLIQVTATTYVASWTEWDEVNDVFRLYVQAYDENGNELWPTQASPSNMMLYESTLGDTSTWIRKVEIAPDRIDGAIVAWSTYGNQIYGQRILGNGTIEWNTGSPLLIADIPIANPATFEMTTSTGGTPYILYNYSYDWYMHKLNPLTGGSGGALWPTLVRDSDTNVHLGGDLIPGHDNNVTAAITYAYTCWYCTFKGYYLGVYQVEPTGAVASIGGRSENNWEQWYASNPKIISDGEDGYYLSWHEYAWTDGEYMKVNHLYPHNLYADTWDEWQLGTSNYFQSGLCSGSTGYSNCYTNIALGDGLTEGDNKTLFVYGADSSGRTLYKVTDDLDPNYIAYEHYKPLVLTQTDMTALGYAPEIVSDGTDLPYLVWGGEFMGDTENSLSRIWNTKVGDVSWEQTGEQVSIIDQDYYYYGMYNYVYESNPAIVSDGNGGFLVHWLRSIYSEGQPTNIDNYIQRVNSAKSRVFNGGTELLVSDGDSVSLSETNQRNIQLAKLDDGFVTVWEDDIENNYRIMGEKFDLNGDPQWNSAVPGAGILINKEDTNPANYYDSVAMAADEVGGVKTGGMITAYRGVAGSTYTINIQKTDSDGNNDTTWDASGNGRTIVSTATLIPQDQISIVSDGNGGAYVTWTQGNYVFGQQIDGATGDINTSWASSGGKNISGTTAGWTYTQPMFMRRSSDGTLNILYKAQYTSSDYTYVRTIDTSTGSSLSSTTVDGNGTSFDADYTSDDNLVIATEGQSDGQIRLTKFTPTSLSSYLWQTIISDGPYDKNPVVAADGYGGATVAWEQYNGDPGTASDIVTAKLSSDGTVTASPQIITDETDTTFKRNVRIAQDGRSGASIAWEQWNAAETEKNVHYAHVVNGIINSPQYGKVFTNDGPYNYNIAMDGDETGVIVAWEKSGSPPDIFGQYEINSYAGPNSTFTAVPTSVVANGSDYSTLTATLLDETDTPVVGAEIEVSVVNSTNPVTATIELCDVGSDITDASGEACFWVKDTSANDYTFAATDITDPGNTVTIEQTADVSFTEAPPALSITDITPNQGPTSGDTFVTITGQQFVVGDTTVDIGGASCTGVVVDPSGLSLTCTTSTHVSGQVDVVVSTSSESDTLTSGYEYLDPVVDTIVPPDGTIYGGTDVTITGENFIVGATTVSLGGSSCDSVVVDPSGLSLTCTTTPHSAGLVDVVVSILNGSGTLTNGYEYTVGSVIVTDVNPHSGSTAGGTHVTITGTGFEDGATVNIGGTDVDPADIHFIDSTMLLAITPPHAIAEAVDITVTNPDLQFGKLLSTDPNHYEYVDTPDIDSPPTVTYVDPPNGSTAGGTTVQVTGTNFATNPNVYFDTTLAPGISYTNATTLDGTTPAHAAGLVDVVVINQNGMWGIGVDLFTYNSPLTVTDIYPEGGLIAGGETAVITGTNFLNITDVTFGTNNCTDYTVDSDTQITCNSVPAGNSTGSVDVTVTSSSNGSATLTDGYTYFSDCYTVEGAGTTDINGDYLYSSSLRGYPYYTRNGASDDYYINYYPPVEPTFVISNSLASPIVAPDSLFYSLLGNNIPGTYSVSEGLAPGPTVTECSNFAVTNVTPNFGPTAGGTAVTITGTSFIDQASISDVTFDGVSCAPYVVVSDTEITCSTPAHAEGPVDVVVTSVPYGSATLTDGFTYTDSSCGLLGDNQACGSINIESGVLSIFIKDGALSDFIMNPASVGTGETVTYGECFDTVDDDICDGSDVTYQALAADLPGEAFVGVQDLRGISGSASGWALTVEQTGFTKDTINGYQGDGDDIPQTNFKVVTSPDVDVSWFTFAPTLNSNGIWAYANTGALIDQITAPLSIATTENGAGENTMSETAFTAYGTTVGTNASPTTLFTNPPTDNPKTGQFGAGVAYQLTIPSGQESGSYQNSITYTVAPSL